MKQNLKKTAKKKKTPKNYTKDDFIRRWRKDAENGDWESARKLLIQFQEDYSKKRPIYDEVLKHLYNSFGRYLDGEETIENAMLLNRPKERPVGTGKDDPRDLSLAYHQLLINDKKMKKTQAKKMIAATYYTTVRNVEYAIKEFPMEEWGEDILKK